MALTQQHLDELEEAIATGELEVTFSDGRKVRYRSINELKEAHRIVSKKVSKKRRAKSVRMTVSKG